MTDRADPKKETSEDATPGPRGLACPSCECRHLHVIYTRRAFGNRIMRRRECRYCGRRITTYEQSLD